MGSLKKHYPAVTSPETLFTGYSVKTMLYKSTSPTLHCIRLLGGMESDYIFLATMNIAKRQETIVINLLRHLMNHPMSQ